MMRKEFFYCQYPQPKSLKEDDKLGTEVDSNKHQKVYYHQICTPQSEDKLIFETPDEPGWMFGAEVSDDGRYFVLRVFKDCDPINKFYYADLNNLDLTKLNGLIPVIKLIDTFDAEYSLVTNESTLFFFKTNLNAPKYKVIAIDLDNPSPEHRKEIIPESKNVLSYVFCVHQNILVVCYMKDVVDVLELYSLDGKLIKNLSIPLGTINSPSGWKQDTMFFYKFTSFLEPGTIYRYDFNENDDTKRLTVFREAAVTGFNPSQFETKQVFFQSKDGTRIPMFIVYKKPVKLDSNNPVLLYGYGGFNYAIQPSFSSFRIVWLQHFNGILAIPNIRGGGEYGEEWHQAGVKHKKQNVFDDFQAAAKYLIQEKYTNPKLLSISGGSNGGLLVGACINQTPELYGCAVAAVGVMDMLRFHKFTIGNQWCSDYGCADNLEDFKYLIKYSPVHNVPKGKPFPAVLLVTADHDDRVPPLHSYKYIAALQNELGNEPYQSSPLLIRIDTKAGHGGGRPTAKIIEEQADVYSFIAYSLGLTWQE